MWICLISSYSFCGSRIHLPQGACGLVTEIKVDKWSQGQLTVAGHLRVGQNLKTWFWDHFKLLNTSIRLRIHNLALSQPLSTLLPSTYRKSVGMGNEVWIVEVNSWTEHHPYIFEGHDTGHPIFRNGPWYTHRKWDIEPDLAKSHTYRCLGPESWLWRNKI